MGKMSLTSCRALSTPGKFSNVDRYGHYMTMPMATGAYPGFSEEGGGGAEIRQRS